MNRNIKERDELIFGDYKPERYGPGGFAPRFEITAETAKELIDREYLEPDDMQNYSPTAAEFLKLSKDHEDAVTFHGYTISDLREDYRVTLDGIVIRITTISDLIRYVNELHQADEFELTQEEDCILLRAWWD